MARLKLEMEMRVAFRNLLWRLRGWSVRTNTHCTLNAALQAPEDPTEATDNSKGVPLKVNLQLNRHHQNGHNRDAKKD